MKFNKRIHSPPPSLIINMAFFFKKVVSGSKCIFFVIIIVQPATNVGVKTSHTKRIAGVAIQTWRDGVALLVKLKSEVSLRFCWEFRRFES